MRLIDADEIRIKPEYMHDICGVVMIRVEDIARILNDMPTIEPEPHWIPCSKRLPEQSGRYLISVLDGIGRRTTVAPYQPRYKAWTMTGRMAYWKVVAWQPLPEPYQGEGEQDGNQ